MNQKQWLNVEFAKSLGRLVFAFQIRTFMRVAAIDAE
jgi:hypothetical protein